MILLNTYQHKNAVLFMRSENILRFVSTIHKIFSLLKTHKKRKTHKSNTLHKYATVFFILSLLQSSSYNILHSSGIVRFLSTVFILNGDLLHSKEVLAYLCIIN